MNFLSKDYLPDSQQRIAYLQKIIRGRPVAILAAGPSIHQLEKRIAELRHADICYFGINKFFVQETNILHKIDKHMDVITLSGREGMGSAIGSVIDFLKRPEDNLFISTFFRDAFGLLGNDFNLNEFLHAYDQKLLFFSLDKQKNLPNPDRPLHFMESNSLLLLIQLALIGKAQSIVLFGADGHGGEGSNKYYYRQDEYSIKGWSGVNESLMNDTKHFFNNIASIAIENTCRTYDVALTNILNCSVNSFYTPFAKIAYDEAFDFLLNGKNIIGKLDLRVPAKPKAPNAYYLTMQRAINFYNRHKKKFFKEKYVEST